MTILSIDEGWYNKLDNPVITDVDQIVIAAKAYGMVWNDLPDQIFWVPKSLSAINADKDKIAIEEWKYEQLNREHKLWN